jgi:hypothetical protein
MRFLNNSLTAKLAGNGFFEQYRYLIMAITLNLPVIFFILLMDMKQVNLSLVSVIYISCLFAGYYILILTVLLFALKRVLALFVGAAVVFYVYYLLIDHFVYTIAKIHIDLFWLEWIINDFHSFGLPSSTLRYVLLAFFYWHLSVL